MNKSFSGLMLLPLLTGCVQSDFLMVTVEDVSEAECPNGGVRILVGEDLNDNGLLEEDEVQSSEVVCDDDGDNASQSPDATPTEQSTGGGRDESEPEAEAFVDLYIEPVGFSCALGGVNIASGYDIDGDGELGSAEIKKVTTVCALADIDGTAAPVIIPKISGSLKVKDGEDLELMAGVEVLEGSLTFDPELQEMQVKLPLLRQVDGSVLARGLQVTDSLNFRALESVGADFIIDDVPELDSIYLGDSVLTVGNDMRLEAGWLRHVDLPDHLTVAGSLYFDELQKLGGDLSVEVGGTLNVSNTGLTSLTIAGMPELYDVVITSNILLDNISFDSAITTINSAQGNTNNGFGDLIIRENFSLRYVGGFDSLVNVSKIDVQGFEAMYSGPMFSAIVSMDNMSFDCLGCNDMSKFRSLENVSDTMSWNMPNLDDVVLPYNLRSVNNLVLSGFNTSGGLSFPSALESIGSLHVMNIPTMLTMPDMSAYGLKDLSLTNMEGFKNMESFYWTENLESLSLVDNAQLQSLFGLPGEAQNMLTVRLVNNPVLQSVIDVGPFPSYMDLVQIRDNISLPECEINALLEGVDVETLDVEGNGDHSCF